MNIFGAKIHPTGLDGINSHSTVCEVAFCQFMVFQIKDDYAGTSALHSTKSTISRRCIIGSACSIPLNADKIKGAIVRFFSIGFENKLEIKK